MSDEHPLTTATFLQSRAGSFESAHGNGDGLSYYGPGDAKLDRDAAELIARLTAERDAALAEAAKMMAVVRRAQAVDAIVRASGDASDWLPSLAHLHEALAALDGKETTDG